HDSLPIYIVCSFYFTMIKYILHPRIILHNPKSGTADLGFLCKATYLFFHLSSNQTRNTTSKPPVNNVTMISCHHVTILHPPQKKVPCRNLMAYLYSNIK